MASPERRQRTFSAGEDEERIAETSGTVLCTTALTLCASDDFVGFLSGQGTPCDIQPIIEYRDLLALSLLACNHEAVLHVKRNTAAIRNNRHIIVSY